MDRLSQAAGPEGAGPSDEELRELLDDLLEASERVWNADITRFQLSQHERWKAVEDSSALWRHEQLAAGHSVEHTEFCISTHLGRIKQEMRAETHRYVREMSIVRDMRDRAIFAFGQARGAEAHA